MCNTFAVYFQIFATFGYKKVKNSDINPRPPVQTFMIVTFAKTAIMIMRIIRAFSSRRCCWIDPY